MKKNRWQTPLFLLGIFLAFTLLNFISSIKPANEKVKELIDRNKGILLVVKSYTDKDKEFLATVKSYRWRLKGKAGIIITDKKSGYNVGYTQSDEELPLLIVFNQYGNIIQIFKSSINRAELEKAVKNIEDNLFKHEQFH
ncbi:hypothetical protein M0P98_02675 [bacterium]|nr:hypothetical protein [bacterium]